MSNRIQLVVAALFGIALGAAAVQFVPGFIHTKSAHQPYADQHGRQISSLSAADVEQLKAGKGWGLAKPAEFNGYPGPLHVLELEDKLSLTGRQKAAVEASFKAMRATARALGEKLIEAEAALDSAFKSNAIDRDKLAMLLGEAERLRAELRSTHLAAHLQVTPLLSEEQKTLYASLRGYGDGHSGHGGH